MAPSDIEIKRQVREFYNQVGWQEVGEGIYQNARYEDLRPISQEYINRCHARVARYLAPNGKLLLDAGSGPIQYPAYLAYSRGYAKRVCVDISHTALKAARQRIGEHGAFVVADVTRLPFAPDAFDGVVALHTIHHLPKNEHVQGFIELHRVLAPNRVAVVVTGWDHSPLMDFFHRIIARRVNGSHNGNNTSPPPASAKGEPQGTFVAKHDAAWLRAALQGKMRFKIRVWRSASTNFLRFFVRPEWRGKLWLKLLYRLEELFPRYFGEKGLYPMVIIDKAAE